MTEQPRFTAFSQIQVAEAGQLAAAAGVVNVRYEVADAQVHPFGDGAFDVVLSRLGDVFRRPGGGVHQPAEGTAPRRQGIEFTRIDEPMLIGRNLDDVLGYERTFPSASEVLAGLSPARAAELAGQVRDSLVAYTSPAGVIMPAAAWLVTAHAL